MSNKNIARPVVTDVVNALSQATPVVEYAPVIDITPVIEDAPIVEPINFLASRLNKALTIDTNSYFEKIENGDGTQLEVTKKTYNLVNPIGKRTTATIYDLSIIEAMEKITAALHGKAILTYSICKNFANIAKTGKLENMGFKNIAEFGKAFYGLETSTVNHYVRIGDTFINDDYTIKNGLPDLSVSHFIELSAKVVDGDIAPIIELYQAGTLVDGMSTKKIRETLKSLSTPVIEDKTTETDNKSDESQTNENTATVVPNETEMNELSANFDSQVIIGKIMNACSVIESLFGMLNEHEINAIGYSDNLDCIKALAKALL